MHLYTVFKRLKELRNRRKELVLELEKVQAITDRFDCDIMREIYEEIEAEYAAAENVTALDHKPVFEAV